METEVQQLAGQQPAGPLNVANTISSDPLCALLTFSAGTGAAPHTWVLTAICIVSPL